MKGQLVNDFILVEFDPVPTVGGIIVPERYLIQEADELGENNAYGVNTNRKAINPQVVTVIKGNGAWLNQIKETYPDYEREEILKSTPLIPDGKRYFVYYGAYEIAKWLTDKQALIPSKTIFFGIEPIEPMPNTYLGEEVFSEGDKTQSGIYTTPYAERKEGILIRITHIPKEGHVSYGDKLIAVGDIVVTIDQHQYDLRFEDKKYIKLKGTEIVGVKTEDGYVPTGDRVLIEYLPDSDLQERIAENDRRANLLDFMEKNGLHYTATDLEPLKEPKTVTARLLAIGNDVNLKTLIGEIAIGDEAIVFRNYGHLLEKDLWITSIENVVGVLV